MFSTDYELVLRTNHFNGSTMFFSCISLFVYREILPEKHVEYFEPWVYSFGYELIIQSTRLPFISGFYKLLSVAMKIAKRIKYFQVRSSCVANTVL